MTTERIWPLAETDDDPTPPENPGVPTLGDRIISAVMEVYDPEIPVNIVDLGLIYSIDLAPGDVDPNAISVHVIMTLTTPNCPEAEALPMRVRQVIQKVPETGDVDVDVVWDPPWDQSKLSDEAKLVLGLM